MNLITVMLFPNSAKNAHKKTVLEGASQSEIGDIDDDSEEDSPHRRYYGGHNYRWCKPSCIPISLICLLIFLVVLLPLVDHAAEKTLNSINLHRDVVQICSTGPCHLELVESIPQGMNFSNANVNNLSTFNVWLSLIQNAKSTIDIASFYWTLRQSDILPLDPSATEGDQIFDAIIQAGTERNISIRIAQNRPNQDYPSIDIEILLKRKAAQVRSLNFAKLLGNGVLHTKLWIIDSKHLYIGSANMDWRSLTQVKELGIAVYNCSCIASDVAKIFEVYWMLGQENATVPLQWPSELRTTINMDSPLKVTSSSNDTFTTFVSSSPLPFNPIGRTNDIDALLNVIRQAEKFVYVAVMDYLPLTIYSPKRRYWSYIDDALKSASIERHVKVRLLISWWNHSRTAEENFLESLAAIDKSYAGVSVQVRRFVVPANQQQQHIPYARVNHNKYMVTDNAAFIGTSNWAGDYFIDTAGVSFVLNDTTVFNRSTSRSTTSVRYQLENIFNRDWNSEYAFDLH